MARNYIRVDTRQLIYSDDDPAALIGPGAPNKTFTPWSFDNRIWTDEYSENAYLRLPALGDIALRGITDEYWQSGVGNNKIDLEVRKIVSVRQESENYWTPEIQHGHYFKYNQPRYLFADRAVTQFVDNDDDGANGNELQLSHVVKDASPIWAVMWTRNELREPKAFRFVTKMANFTGIYSGGVQQDTRDDAGDIIWANVDTAKHEFVVDWNDDYDSAPKLYFNKDFTFLVGKDTIDEDDDLEYCEYLGGGTGEDNQIFFTKYFPIIDNDELTLYVNVWDNTKVKDTDYRIDFDRGEIVFTDRDGVDLAWKPDVDDQLYLRYRPTLEVEYEPEYCGNYLTADGINLNPINTGVNRGFIFLSEQEMRVASLVLTTDKPAIDMDSYGPMYIGSDYCFLVATAYNAFGTPVPDQEVLFYINDIDAGFINGSTSEVSAITNEDGEARVVYSPPRTVEAISQYLRHNTGADGAKRLKLLETSGISEDTLTDVFIYKVWDDDGQIDDNGTVVTAGMRPWRANDSGEDEPGYGGRKVIMYKWTSDAIYPNPYHPEYGFGCFAPVNPIGIEEEDGDTYLVFEDNLANTEEMNPGNPGTLVSYWVAIGKEIPCQAKCYSSLYNNWVYSNEVHLQLTVPNYLKGTYIDVNGVIPYGFRLRDATSDIASGLDGLTYLSINPEVSSWPIIS